MLKPFFVKDCTLVVMATGMSASSLVEFRDVLERVPTNSIYHHFWGSRLSPFYVHPEYHNDFAHWANDHLHDEVLSERLNILDPKEYSDLESLRRILLEIFEDRLDEIEFLLWSKRESKFHFLRSSIIVFDTGISLSNPIEFKTIIPTLSAGSIFYHFIDARKRTPEGTDDFSYWLSGFNSEHKELISKIRLIDPFFLSLTETRQKLTELMNKYFP